MKLPDVYKRQEHKEKRKEEAAPVFHFFVVVMIIGHITRGVDADKTSNHRYNQHHNNRKLIDEDMRLHRFRMMAEKLKPGNEKRLRSGKQRYKIFFVLKAEENNEAHDEEFGYQHYHIDGCHIFKESQYFSLQKPLNGENGSYRNNSYTANIRHCLTEIIVLYNS